ncbi:MAG: Hpt domain-containing protein [Spirochaetes bacterium]|nr:Hpt domain-containing protein [Spirochaetota bacterium]
MPNSETIKISGLNVKNGLSRTGGKPELYIETLGAFFEDGQERLVELKKSLETGNMSLYVIHIHGVKSAATFIGADELAEAAAALEAAGETNDLAFVETHNPGFMQNLEVLLTNIHDFLKPEKTDSCSLDRDVMNLELKSLQTAIDIFDTATINKNIDCLLKLTQDLDQNITIRKISDHILTGDFNDAATLIDSLLRKEAY